MDHLDEEDKIGPSGMLTLCEDLDIPPEDIRMLILAFLLSADRIGYFTEKEFVEGLEALRISTLKKLKEKLDEVANINDSLVLKEIYLYTFHFAKEEGTRVLFIDTAIEFLKLLLKDNEHTEPFCKYLEDQAQTSDGYKAMNYDQWKMYFEFANSVASDFSNYNSCDAWPLLIDLYVEKMESS